MGDHYIGREMGRAADLWWQARSTLPSRDEALGILDQICTPHRGRDAEFESEDPNHPGYIHPDYDYYTDPKGPIGRLIVIAFDAKSEEMLLGDEDTCPWIDGVGTFDSGPYVRFRNRYNFC